MALLQSWPFGLSFAFWCIILPTFGVQVASAGLGMPFGTSKRYGLGRRFSRSCRCRALVTVDINNPA